MLKCKKCKGRMLIDRIYNSINHIEIYCLLCGTRIFFTPPEKTSEGLWLLKKEQQRAKDTISLL